MRATTEVRRPGAVPWEAELRDRWGSQADDSEPLGPVTSTGALPRPRRAAAEAPAAEAVAATVIDRTAAVAWLLRFTLLVIVGVLLVVVGMALIDWLRVKVDDLRYGRPRLTQMAAYVGHNETEGSPTTLMAMNLNRRITIVEIPGGDSSKIRTIQGPYLVGRDEDLTVATMRLVDVNGDSHLDLLLRVKQEELVYINDRGEFRLMTKTERPVVERALGGGQ